MTTKAGRFNDDTGAMDEATNRRLFDVLGEIDPDLGGFDEKGHANRIKKVVKGIADFRAKLEKEKHKQIKFYRPEKEKKAKRTDTSADQSLPNVVAKATCNSSGTKLNTKASLC